MEALDLTEVSEAEEEQELGLTTIRQEILEK